MSRDSLKQGKPYDDRISNMQISKFFIALQFLSVGEVNGACRAHVKFLCYAAAIMRKSGSTAFDGKSLYVGIVADRRATASDSKTRFSN